MCAARRRAGSGRSRTRAECRCGPRAAHPGSGRGGSRARAEARNMSVAGSLGSGAALSIPPSRIAASATVRAIGPAMSWSRVTGAIPHRLIRPSVGRMPTSMFAFDGLMTEPPVSVPTFAAQKLAAVPIPELEPPVLRAGRPSNVAGRGVAARVVRVVSEAGQRIVVAGHGVRRPRHPVRELGEARLGDDDRASFAQVGGQRGLVRRHVAVECQRPRRGGEVGRVDVVLERDGDAREGGPGHCQPRARRPAHPLRPARSR